jgi:hypothetical protein
MNDPDLQRRLDALITALVPTAPSRPVTGTDADNTGADAQRIATAHVDDLLRRVSTLTATLGNGTHEWDDADRIAARLLMADLAAIASTTRALNDLSASRLASALADLRAAGVDIERTVKEASGS